MPMYSSPFQKKIIPTTTMPHTVPVIRPVVVSRSINFIFPCLPNPRSEEHTSELQSRFDLVCRLLLEKKTSTQLATITAFRQSVVDRIHMDSDRNARKWVRHIR